jgi:protein-S-isoprenylcysteine O-methyltransferase Ste14
VTPYSHPMQRLAARASVGLLGLVVLYAADPLLAETWFVASRLAYVLFVGFSLRAASRRRKLSQFVGAEEAWRRFARVASWLMENDVVAFVAACVVTRGTLALPTPRWVEIAAGAALTVVGVVVKWWANASLEKGSWLWRGCFVRPEGERPSAVGPYRWLRNPMYTVGYAHTYGFALLVGSLPGLVASALAQGAILVMNELVERPHVLEDDPPA